MVSTTIKTDYHEITELLFKVVLNTHNLMIHVNKQLIE
jgi:hypothetical protein